MHHLPLVAHQLDHDASRVPRRRRPPHSRLRGRPGSEQEIRGPQRRVRQHTTKYVDFRMFFLQSSMRGKGLLFETPELRLHVSSRRWR